MTLSVILVECDLTDPDGVPATLRFSDRAIFPMPADDPDRPNAVWEERLIEPPTLRRALFDDLQSLEPGLGVGDMVLANADRALDAYQGWVWGEVRVWRWIYGSPFGEARALMTGPAAGTPAYDVNAVRPGRVRLTLYDYRLELERPVQSATFGGANDVDGDVFFDGDVGLKGRLKPLAFGDLRQAHVPAPPVNHEVGAFQLHDGRIPLDDGGGDVVQIFDRGADAGFGFGGDVSPFIFTDEDFYEQSLAPALWYLWSAQGRMKLNGEPVGSVAFGLMGDAPGGDYADTPGPIIARVLARLDVPPERIGASVAAFDCDRTVGAWIDQPTSGRELIGWLATAAPMAVLPDRFGVWQAVALAPPAETADHLVTADAVLAIEADEAAAQGAGEFRVGYDRIWTTYRRDNLQVELHRTAAEQRLAEAYRYVLVEDAPFKARFPAAWRKLALETPLRAEADATALAAALKALFGLRPDGRPRRTWRLALEMTDAVLDVDLGATVEVAAPGWGVTGRFVLIAEEPLRPRRDQIIWTLWG